MEIYSLNAEKRKDFGKRLAGLRQKGLMPAVLYGKSEKSESISVPLKEFQKIFKSAGETSVLELALENEKKNVMIYDVQYDPVTSAPIHADFLAVKMDEPIEANVPLVYEGDSEAVKAGGVLVKVLHELEIKALPRDIPHKINIDISGLKTSEDKILISDLKLSSKVEILGKEMDDVIALIEIPQEETAEEASIDFEKIEATKEKKEEEKEE